MESKSREQEQFETWFRSKHEGQMITKGKGYSEPMTQILWQAWQASRAALVVELPSKITEVNRLYSGHVLPEVAAYDEAIDDCSDSIRAAGITVKGEGDGDSEGRSTPA